MNEVASFNHPIRNSIVIDGYIIGSRVYFLTENGVVYCNKYSGEVKGAIRTKFWNYPHYTTYLSQETEGELILFENRLNPDM